MSAGDGGPWLGLGAGSGAAHCAEVPAGERDEFQRALDVNVELDDLAGAVQVDDLLASTPGRLSASSHILATMSFDNSTLLPLALKLLPHSQSSASDSNEQTTLDSPIEALALLIHAIHTQVGFRLVQPAPAQAQEGAEATVNQLPATWTSNGAAKFRYKHEQSSLEFVITVTELGGRAMIAAVAVENPKSVSFDLLLTDYFSQSTFPLKLSASSSSSDLEAAFSSPARLKDLITLYRLNILQPLIPGLRKDGYSELPASANPSSSSSSSGRVSSPQGPYYPDNGGPLMGIPGRGGGMAFPPSRGGGGGDDPLRIPGSAGRGVGAPNPHDIGRSDLLPLGGMGGTFGSAGPSSNPFGGVGGGGGMFMGRDEFRDRFGGDGSVGGRGGGAQGPWGGDGYLPPMGAPPGARFDPVGPAGGSGPPQPGGTGFGGFGGGHGIGSFPGGRGGGGRAPQRSGDPDWDGDRPPGFSGNDYDAMFG